MATVKLSIAECLKYYHAGYKIISTAQAESIEDIHETEYVEIMYCRSGSFTVCNEKGLLYHLQKGDMATFSVGEKRNLSADSAGHCIVYYIKPQILFSYNQNIFEMKYILPFTHKDSNLQKFFTAKEIEGSDLKKSLLAIYNELEKQPCCFEMAMRTHIYTIFVWIARHWWKTNQMNKEIQDVSRNILEKLDLSIAYIDKHYASQLNVKKLSYRINVSYNYFSKMFKETTGYTFKEYLNRLRMKKAKEMLLNKNIPITDIALECGYNSTSYFIKLFKEKNGMTPIQFRKISNQKNKADD